MIKHIRFAFLTAIILGQGSFIRAYAANSEREDVPVQETVRDVPRLPSINHPDDVLSLQRGKSNAEIRDPSQQTLAPAPATNTGMDEVELKAHKTLMLSSEATWENGFNSLAAAFKILDEIAISADLEVQGRPFAVFTQSAEDGFHFDAMLPVKSRSSEVQAQEILEQTISEIVAADPENEKMARLIRFGHSPAGKAYRFAHTSPYDDIDTTYEAVSAFLDSNGLVVQEAFIEEYVSDLTEPTDESLEIYIYVQPVTKIAEEEKGQDKQSSNEISPSSDNTTVPDQNDPNKKEPRENG